MNLTEDMALLCEYAAHGADAAFETVVRRHVHFVYSSALRQVRDPQLAEEITQAVFIILARKAGRIRKGSVLSGWLFTTVRFVAAAEFRAAARRRRYELEAGMESSNSEANPHPWEQIAPFLDEGLAQLSEKDRQAVLLRFFEEKSFADVARALGAREDAARMRVTRALKTMRGFFQKRGVALTTVALAAALSANAVQAAPTGIVASVAAGAAVKGSAVSSSTSTLIKGALKLMAWTKAKTVIVVGTVAIFAGGTATVVLVKTMTAAAPPASLAQVDDGLKQEPGIKKFRARHKISGWIPGRVLLMGGWSTEPGKRLLVIITPTVYDTTGNRATPPFNARSRVQIDTKFIMMPERDFLRVAALAFFTGESDSQKVFQDGNPEHLRQMMDSIDRSPGIDTLSAPRVTTQLGHQAHMSMQDTQMIAGKKQALGPSLDVSPTFEDADSVNLAILVQYTMADPGVAR